MDYFNSANIGTGFNPQQNIVGWGSGEQYGNSSATQVQQATQLFQQQFQNLMGRPPTADELGSFQSQALQGAINAPGDLTYGDSQGLASAFINNQYGPQIAKYQQDQQTKSQQDQLQQTLTSGSNLVDQLNQKTQNYLTSPEAQSQIQGQLNNKGMLNSGAYSSTLAGLMAQGANQNQASVLSGVGVPALQNIQGLSGISGNPYSQSMTSGSNALGNIEGINNFGMQQSLAQMLAQIGQPSSAEKYIGMAGAAGQAASGAATGSAGAAKATSYICLEMIARGLLQEWQLDELHYHIMPAMFRKGRAFWAYATKGLELVQYANNSGIDWKEYVPLFYDRVMREPDPTQAVDLYALATKDLALRVAPHLWDERVMRTGVVDSLPFIPLLFTNARFRATVKKVLRMKMLWVYDHPLSRLS